MIASAVTFCTADKKLPRIIRAEELGQRIDNAPHYKYLVRTGDNLGTFGNCEGVVKYLQQTYVAKVVALNPQLTERKKFTIFSGDTLELPDLDHNTIVGCARGEPDTTRTYGQR